VKDWVLVADTYGQSRSAVATVRALGRAGFRVAATTGRRRSLAGASRYCRSPVQVPTVTEPGFTDQAFANAVRAELARNDYLAVMPTSDAALLALGRPIGHLVDKACLAEGARNAGLALPPTRVFARWQDLLIAADGLDYPLVVKPTVSRWRPIRIETRERLRSADPRRGALLVQPFIDAQMSSIAGVTWRGELIAAVHQRYLRTWPRECGTSSAAVTVEPDLHLEGALLRLLEGYEGVFQAQFAGPYLLDLNPRPYGSLPLAVAAGANLPAIHCDLLRGYPVLPVRARPGIFYRWVEADIRHVWQSLRAGTMTLPEAAMALRPQMGTAHSTESLNDLGPALARIRFALGGRR
jgi:hypothetical protein